MVATVAVVLGLLMMVFELASQYSASQSSKNAVPSHLVTPEVSGSTAAESAHQTSIALLLHGWVACTVLLPLPLPWRAVRVLALGILILHIGSLLRELIMGLRARVASLLILGVLPGSIFREMF